VDSLGESWGLGRRAVSEEIACEVDKEVRRIIDECQSRARQVLAENKAALERISQTLPERESLDGDDLDLLIAGAPLSPDIGKRDAATRCPSQSSTSTRSAGQIK